MGFKQVVTTCFSKYVSFKGRAARPEFWLWILFVCAVPLILILVGQLILDDASVALAALAGVFILATLLPTLAVYVRRLHDTGRSGWFLFIQLIPAIGPLLLLYFLAQAGTPGPNKFDTGMAVV